MLFLSACGIVHVPFLDGSVHPFLRVLQVLQLVAERCSDASIICLLLQLNTACTQALQQSIGVVAANDRRCRIQGRDLSRQTSFAAWLPKHANLVASISYHQAPEHQADVSTAQQLLTAALQACAQPPVIAAGPAAADAVVGMQNRMRWPLQRLSSSYIHSAEALQALAAASCLTSLELSSSRDLLVTEDMCTALGRLATCRSCV